jgi:hypothetical protein
VWSWSDASSKNPLLQHSIIPVPRVALHALLLLLKREKASELKASN